MSALILQNTLGAQIIKDLPPALKDNPRIALKALVVELYNQGVSISDIADVIGVFRGAVTRWVFMDAVPQNVDNFDEVCNKLLSLLDHYKDTERKILKYLRGGHKFIKEIRRHLKVRHVKALVFLDNLVKLGLIRRVRHWHAYKLTPEGVAESNALKIIDDHKKQEDEHG